MNFIEEQLAVWRLKQRLHKYVRPDRAFLKSARTRFVTLGQQKTGVTVRAQHPRSWRYATVTIATVFAMTSGMTVFADVNNVPVTHPLYNLKRASEQVRLGLSSPTQQVELHRVFAHRRLEEASELETESQIPAQVQNRIDKLNKDFENETETGINKAQRVVDHPEVRTQLCNDILNTIQNKPMGNKLPKHMIDRIKSKCDNKETIKNANEKDNND